MNRKATRILSTHQLRALEAQWIESCHKDWGLVLMELAGRKTAERAKAMWEKYSGEVTIFCGRGNNGGDGLVVARYLRLWDVPVNVYITGGTRGGQTSKVQTRNESTTNKEVLEKLGLQIKTIEAYDLEEISKAARQSGIIVDALLGTGLDRPLEGLYYDLVDLINNCRRPVLAVDIATGINSDNGQVMGIAVEAVETVTFGYLKAGLLCHPGAAHTGKITLVDIGLPDIESNEELKQPKWWLSTADYVGKLLPKRPENSHKGSFGTVLTVAGSMNYRGAATLAAMSALRVGAGLSILATPKSLIPEIAAQEIIYKALPETDNGAITEKALSELISEMKKATALVVGPGLGQSPETVKFVHQFISAVDKPCLIDADGLNALSEKPEILPSNCEFILTPHPKELSRLTGLSPEEIQYDRIGAAGNAARAFGAIIVLKGAHTIIAHPLGEVFLNPTGNAGMATAGAGDVLSGIIGGLLGQGLKPFDAAVAGTYIHGLAGDLAQIEIGATGFVAGDISTLVPAALTNLHSPDFPGCQLEQQLFS